MNSEMDTSGARFVPMVAFTHNDDGTNSHKSDIPLQLPASANVPSNTSALGSQSPTDTKSDWNEPLAIAVSRCIPSKCTCSSWTSRSCSSGYTKSTRRSVRRIKMKRLRGNTLSILRQEVAKHQITTCRCKFGNSNMKQMRDFHKVKGNFYCDSLIQQIKLYGGGDEQVHDSRTELSPHVPHSEHALRKTK